jgi:transposase
LLNDGKTQVKIAQFLGCSLNKVSSWCVHGYLDNLESFKDERIKANHKKVTDKYIKIFLKTTEKEPQELGYEFDRWTTKRLVTSSGNITGIQLSGSQVRRILEQKKPVYLWAKASLEVKRNPEKRKALKKIEEYLKIEKSQTFCRLGFGTRGGLV